jgi:hypothetical protein
MRNLSLILAVATLTAVGGQVLARHVTHPVTPQNIEQQAFAFTVRVKAVGEFEEFEITVGKKVGKLPPAGSATGSVVIDARGKTKAAFPAVTRVVQSNGVQTYTFQVARSDLDRARFTLTETPQDVRTPFPYPGDYWVFDLRHFVASAGK